MAMDQYENVAVPAAQRCILKHGRRAQREQTARSESTTIGVAFGHGPRFLLNRFAYIIILHPSVSS
jgi:hypothetical protein